MKSIKLILCALLFTGIGACTKTTLIVKSNPPGANVVMKGTGISKVTDSKIDVPRSLFEEGNREGIYYDKTEKEYVICLLNTNNKCEIQGVEIDLGKKIRKGEINIGESFYRKLGDKKRYEILVFEKEGYRTQEKPVLLSKLFVSPKLSSSHIRPEELIEAEDKKDEPVDAEVVEDDKKENKKDEGKKEKKEEKKEGEKKGKKDKK